MISAKALLQKYNVPAPRYTSYPTVPDWEMELPVPIWTQHIRQAFKAKNEVSLYVHLPYCERMCTFCGCTKRITKNHAVELPYIDAVLQEWAMYLEQFPSPPVIREIHLGGGTPTFFQPAHLAKLIEGLLAFSQVADNCAFGFEAHPGNTSLEHLQVLRALGFRRISIGVQDFDADILSLIHRNQSYEEVVRVTEQARDLGYDSINYDLVYGLPRQKQAHIIRTVEALEVLKPERIAFYSYAHVPWIKPAQRAYSEEDLPVGEEKRALYETGQALLLELGYKDIGMDHFALPQDALYQAREQGQLYRNFMGYTPFATGLQIGLGASAISDSWTCYAQNEKNIEGYLEQIQQGNFALTRGHELSANDLWTRRHILQLMCQYRTAWPLSEQSNPLLQQAIQNLIPLAEDGLVSLTPNAVEVLPAGEAFIRNICMAFDSRYGKRVERKTLFSQAI